MDSEDEDAQMRQMMGFSDFGIKKRKPNHDHTKNTANASATSSNLMPLGQRPATTMARQPLTMIPASLPPRPAVSPSPQDQQVIESALAKDDLPGPSPIDQDQQKDHGSSTSFNAEATSVNPAQTPSSTTSHTTYSKNDIRSDPSYWNNERPTFNRRRDLADDEIAYTSPWTGATMTSKEIKEYAVGKEEVQADGSVELVFFKPSFVAEGLWDEWEKGAEDNLGSRNIRSFR